MKLSVVIPVYNEEENIRLLAGELGAIASAFEDFEVILVDDGSSDGTWTAIEQCQSEFGFIRGIRCGRNRGQSAAMLRGLRAARLDLVATLDGDLQNDPADLPRLAERVGDYDVVCGYRVNRQDSWSRRVGSRLANRVRSRVTGDGIIDTGCSLKVFRRECVEDLPALAGVHRCIPAYFILNGRTIHQQPVHHRPRLHGVSKYTNLKRLPRTLRDLRGFAWYKSRFVGRDGDK